MHEAEQYLRNPETPYSLYIQYQGRRRRLFYNRDQNICGIIGIGRRRYGFGFGDWDNIEKIFKPAPDKDPEEINRRQMVRQNDLPVFLRGRQKPHAATFGSV